MATTQFSLMSCTSYDLILQTLFDQIATLLGNNIDNFFLNFRSTKKLLSEVEKKIFVQAALEADTDRNIIYRFVHVRQVGNGVRSLHRIQFGKCHFLIPDL